MKKIVKRIALGIVAVVLIGLVALVCVYFTRFQTMATIAKSTGYSDGYNLYTMDVTYDYNVENIIAKGEGSPDAN
ncbi:MAG: hypothetical protein IKG21_09705 [Atopobiaceae bacterium]|nr:hypothetical protein [Atopobiaceae bacterium]